MFSAIGLFLSVCMGEHKQADNRAHDLGCQQLNLAVVMPERVNKMKADPFPHISSINKRNRIATSDQGGCFDIGRRQ
jgi:hypothetical protein